MKVTFELYTHWVQYGRPGGTQLDFDVNRGSTFLGRFESREVAELEIRRLEKAAEGRWPGATVDEEFDSYEIKVVQVPDGSEGTEPNEIAE
ncbi:hypothetical protein [Limnoglobus roseus]|uniref:Uncharacterized protein n=1 Tax=Limnoglobus roseus TaxID=2598579 RepID=A0A5C1ANC4_9BACT|nr:hypothetical protein [Limnoglobus roseus]QEL20909.1 hypothetical protein PX52LOC_08031 [Limnoglobus roseus]